MSSPVIYMKSGMGGICKEHPLISTGIGIGFCFCLLAMDDYIYVVRDIRVSFPPALIFHLHVLYGGVMGH